MLSLCALLFLAPAGALSEELEIVNRPVNISGLTGLLFTTSPYTLAPGTVEFGASILSESSAIPDYTMTEFPLTASVGLTGNSEVAIRGSYFQIKEGSTDTSGFVDRKTGDLEVAYKWNFLPQTEPSTRPAAALIVAGIFPTEKNQDLVINAVAHWGMRLGLSTGTEINWRDHILGMYADAQVKGQDLTEKRLSDIYELFNAGLLFPISKYQNLQMLIEYSLVHGRNIITLDGGDYSGFTYGFRLVSERFNLTIGTQFLHKQSTGYDNSDRMIGLMSIKF